MSDDQEFGPAMTALNERQRLFVLAMVERPGCTHAQAAREAGYSDVASAAKVRGHHLAQHPGVQAAIHEVTGLRLNANSLLAADALIKIMQSSRSADKDRMKAAGMLLDRTGFGASQTINVNKTVIRKVNASEAMAKIAEFREKFPLQFAKMIGSAVPEPIEGEFSEVSE